MSVSSVSLIVMGAIIHCEELALCALTHIQRQVLFASLVQACHLAVGSSLDILKLEHSKDCVKSVKVCWTY